jgi:hypothetical protein
MGFVSEIQRPSYTLQVYFNAVQYINTVCNCTVCFRMLLGTWDQARKICIYGQKQSLKWTPIGRCGVGPSQGFTQVYLAMSVL